MDSFGSLSRLARTLPRPLRQDLSVLVSFVSHVRRIVDAGPSVVADRLATFEQIDRDLTAIAARTPPETQCGQSIAPLISARRLPLQPFRDLLVAAQEDSSTGRYATFAQLMGHVRRAANPIGRLTLHLCDAATPRNLALADGLSCGLWLIGMLRDVPGDFTRGRLYLPLEELERFRVAEEGIGAGRITGGWQPLMMFQIERARRMLESGAPLVRVLGGRVGVAARLLVVGGERILKRLHDRPGDVFTQRAVITKRDWPYLIGRAVFPSYRP
jgi:phytoene/squalene synthetase